jgi:lipoprotein-releasing system permease protein
VALGLAIAFNVPFLENLGQFIYPDVYYIPDFPSEVHAGDIVSIAVASLLLTFLATIYPALQAAKTQPAEALRYE